MTRCKYKVLFFVKMGDKGRLLGAQCNRVNFLGSSGWHLHRAPLPAEITAHKNISVRWRSTNTPDHIGI